jgi:glycosidase
MGLTQQDVIYFVVTDRFYGVPHTDPAIRASLDPADPQRYHGGNLDGLREKIPYLSQLGVTAVWITPVYLQTHLPAADGYHGYWALDFNAVDPHLYVGKEKHQRGSKLFVRDLARALHEAGMKLVLDMVVNHTGYGHPGVTNASPNPTPIRGHWFNRAGVSCGQDETQGELSGLPDLDLDNKDVSDYHIRTILDWIRATGIDAVRMDTAKHVERVFWNDFKTQVKGLHPEVGLLGEVLEFDIDRISQFQKYWAFDSLFDFPMQRAMQKVFVDGDSLETFVSPFDRGEGLLEKDGAYTNHNMMTTLLDNHDLPARFMTLLVDRIGDRVAAARAFRLALSFQFAVRGIPQIYYGTELGLEGGADPDNRRDFEWAKLDERHEVRAEFPREKAIYDHLRRLIRVRRESPALTAGGFACLYVDCFVLVFARCVEDDVAIVAIHNGWQDMPASIPVSIGDNPHLPTRIRERLADGELVCALTGAKVRAQEGRFELRMPGKTALILKPAG